MVAAQYDYSSNIVTIGSEALEIPLRKHNILIMDQVLTPEGCQHLIQAMEQERDQWYQAQVPKNTERDHDEVHLNKIYLANMEGPQWEYDNHQIATIMSTVYELYLRQLPYPILSMGLPQHGDYTIDLPTIKKYVPGEFIGPHSDGYMRGWDSENKVRVYKGNRFLNILFYLNDVEEGGETQFYFDDETISVAPRAGRVVAFPPLWTHIHSGTEVKRGVKYIMNGHLRARITEDNFNPENPYQAGY